jgi:hypothetical protein
LLKYVTDQSVFASVNRPAAYPSRAIREGGETAGGGFSGRSRCFLSPIRLVFPWLFLCLLLVNGRPAGPEAGSITSVVNNGGGA